MAIFEEEIEKEEVETTQDLIRQINEVSEAILKCEKMLQHMALGDYGNKDFGEVISQHIRLKGTKERLSAKLAKLQKEGDNVPTNTDGAV